MGRMRCATVFFLILGLLIAPAGAFSGERLLFLRGTAQELEVYRVRGRLPGPTVMIMGGIHGDEPGSYLSAELYADVTLRRGNLIVVPRANFRSILQGRRGVGGDMNRKFSGIAADDPEAPLVEILKSLMAESDYFLSLHDGSGFYRPTKISENAGPNCYGQCVIADADIYRRESGPPIDLKKYAEEAIRAVNAKIDQPLHKFNFFNMRTETDDSPHLEHRNSATYYALTRLGIPAFCIETSKDLPSEEEKILQHNLMVNAFLELFGVEMEQPGFSLERPRLSYLLVSINKGLPVALTPGSTLLAARGDTLEVTLAAANHERGLHVEIPGLAGNGLGRSLILEKPLVLTARKDGATLGSVNIGLLPEGETLARLGEGAKPVRPLAESVQAGLETLPGARRVAALERPWEAAGGAASGSGTEDAADGASGKEPGRVAGFWVEVDGRPVEIPVAGELTVTRGARVRLVNFRTEGGAPPRGVVMNLKGFIAKGDGRNNGEDRGGVADTARDMMPSFSDKKQGEVYALNAEQGKNILASCALRLTARKGVCLVTGPAGAVPVLTASVPAAAEKSVTLAAAPSGAKGAAIPAIADAPVTPAAVVIPVAPVTTAALAAPAVTPATPATAPAAASIQKAAPAVAATPKSSSRPRLLSVTVRIGGQSKILPVGGRMLIPPGAPVELLEVKLAGGAALARPRFTIGGRGMRAALPQTLAMREIAVNLAVFDGETLAGKVTFVPKP